MLDFDNLSFAIAYALRRKSGGEARKLIKCLPDAALDHLAATVADRLRLCGWRQLPPDPPARGDQFPGAAKE